MRKTYTAPEANMILLVPDTAIASWKVDKEDKSWWWNNNSSTFWGTQSTASVPTGTLIYNPNNSEFKYPDD